MLMGPDFDVAGASRRLPHDQMWEANNKELRNIKSGDTFMDQTARNYSFRQ